MATARKNPARVRAGKKAARTRALNAKKPVRRRRTASKAAPRKRRVTRRKKGFLSDLVTPAKSRGAFNTGLTGAAGGFTFEVVDDLLSTHFPDLSKGQRLLAHAAIVYAGYTQLGSTAGAAGYAGATAYKYLRENGGLSDLFGGGATNSRAHQYVPPQVLARMPMTLSDGSGQYYALQDNGEYMALQDNGLAYLGDDGLAYLGEYHPYC